MLSASAGLMLALSTARPVVCSSIPHFDGPPALLEATLRARSVRELADQIERLLSDEELYAEMSRRARDYALSRPFSALAEDYVAFFESILAGQQPEQPAPWADAQPLLGVVIVTRDQKEPLRRALQSIAAPDVPTVVCDEGSSDGTAELLAAEFPQVTYVRPPERGRNRAANVGVQHCPTRYVKFLEAEDLLLPGWYEEHLRRCREGCPLITCGAVTNHGPRLRLINADGVVYGSQLCVKRDLFISVGGFDENGPQLPETDLVARLQACGIVEGQIGKVLVAKEGTTAL
jgi:GT2 family glycosyltransferase